MVLVHAGSVILPELGEKLGRYAQQQLARSGVEIITNAKVADAGRDGVRLADGRFIPSRLIVWTAGTSPHPLLHDLPCQLDHGRIVVDETLAVPGFPGVWAVGDCAVVPDRRTGKPHPPTAQHAIREGKTVARNIAASIKGRPPVPFDFRTIGQLAAIGKRTGVARVAGVNFSGFFAWWLWRTVYLSKLPRLEKKIRVAIDWTLDLVFSKDFVQFLTVRGPAIGASERRAPPLGRGRRGAREWSDLRPAAPGHSCRGGIAMQIDDRTEWLEADGLGGFASGTTSGIRTRRYHALLLPATTPPTGRIVLVNGVDVWLDTKGGSFALSSQRYAPGVVHPDGASRIVSFSLRSVANVGVRGRRRHAHPARDRGPGTAADLPC